MKQNQFNAAASLNLIALILVAFLSIQSWGYEELQIGGQITGESGSYVVRDGVPSWLPSGLENGHAGILWRVLADESATLVYEVRGPGEMVTLSKFSPQDTWGTVSFLESNQFKGCGHSPYCNGLTPVQEQAFREEILAQAARCVGVPYVGTFDFALGIIWVNPDMATYAVTLLDASGTPIVPSSFRCDGLMEWVFEAAQAVITGATGSSVDPNWGVYKAFGSVNDGYKSGLPPVFDPLAMRVFRGFLVSWLSVTAAVAR